MCTGGSHLVYEERSQAPSACNTVDDVMTTMCEIDVELGFTPESHAIDDPQHRGLRRAGPRSGAPYGADGIETHRCRATDDTQTGVCEHSLTNAGFDVVDLSGFDTLQSTFEAIRAAGRISDADAAIIRTELNGAVLPLSGDQSAQVLHIAEEGLIMRCAGPNRLSVVGGSRGMNDHGPATAVHADQDVYGTPLLQVMGGRAPELLVHDSPDGNNHDSNLMLVNLWIPLHQITQPLVLADGRSIDRRRHQLRYGLATDSFLDRDDDQVINDIWKFLYDPAQRWTLHSEMDHRSAYLFNTCSTPHGAGNLAGEDVAEVCYRLLESAEQALEAGDVGALTELLNTAALPQLPAHGTPALRSAIEAMLDLLAAAAAPVATAAHQHGDFDAAEWLRSARAARRTVVRMSLELRLVVSIR